MNYANYGFFSIQFKATTSTTRFGQNSIINSGLSNTLIGAGNTISGSSNIVLGYNNALNINNSIYMGYNITTGNNSLVINTLNNTISNNHNNYFNIMDVFISSNHTTSLQISRHTTFPENIAIGTNSISVCQGTNDTLYIGANLEISGNIAVAGGFNYQPDTLNLEVNGTLSVTNSTTFKSNVQITYSNDMQPMLTISNTNETYLSNQSIIEYRNRNFAMYGILDTNISAFGYSTTSNPNDYVFSIKSNGQIDMYSDSNSVFQLNTVGNIHISKNLYVTGNIRTYSNLNVSGKTTFDDTVNVKSNIIIKNTLTANGQTDINSTSTFLDTATFSSNIIATSTDTFSSFKILYITGYLDISETNRINNTETLTGENNYFVINTGNSSTLATGFFIKRYQVLDNTNTGYITQDTPIITNTLPLSTGATNNIQLFSEYPGYNVSKWIVRFTSNDTNYVRRIESYNPRTFVAVLNSDVPSVNNQFTVRLYDKPSVGLYYEEGTNYFKFVGGLLDVSGAITGVTSNTLFNLSLGDLELVSNMYVSGTINCALAADFSNSITVSNDITLGGTLTTNNIITENGTLTMKNVSDNTVYYIDNNGNVNISGILTVGSDINFKVVNINDTLHTSNLIVESNATFFNTSTFIGEVTFKDFTSYKYNGAANSYPIAISNNNQGINSSVYLQFSNASPNVMLLGMGMSNSASDKLFEILRFVNNDYRNIFEITNDYNLYFKKDDGTTLLHINSNGDLSNIGSITNPLIIESSNDFSALKLYKKSSSGGVGIQMFNYNNNPVKIGCGNTGNFFIEFNNDSNNIPFEMSNDGTLLKDIILARHKKITFTKSTSDKLDLWGGLYKIGIDSHTFRFNADIYYKFYFNGQDLPGIQFSKDGAWINNGKYLYFDADNFDNTKIRGRIRYENGYLRCIGHYGVKFAYGTDSNNLDGTEIAYFDNYGLTMTGKKINASGVYMTLKNNGANDSFQEYYGTNSDGRMGMIGILNNNWVIGAYYPGSLANNPPYDTSGSINLKAGGANKIYLESPVHMKYPLTFANEADQEINLTYYNGKIISKYDFLYLNHNKGVALYMNYTLGFQLIYNLSSGVDCLVQNSLYVNKDCHVTNHLHINKDCHVTNNLNVNNNLYFNKTSANQGINWSYENGIVRSDSDYLYISHGNGVALHDNTYLGFKVTYSGSSVDCYVNNNLHIEGTTYQFTGGHNVVSDVEWNLEENIGKLVEVIDSELIDINNNIMHTKICDNDNSQAIIGVLTNKKYKEDKKEEENPTNFYNGYYHYAVNALGEGGVKVCNHNGNIEIGDLLISCYCGCSKKKTDNINNNIVAKALKKVDWREQDKTTKLIGCIYMCG